MYWVEHVIGFHTARQILLEFSTSWAATSTDHTHTHIHAHHEIEADGSTTLIGHDDTHSQFTLVFFPPTLQPQR